MKLKSQKGSITIFVLIALLFYTAFLLLMYAANTNKFKTISEKSEILKGIYEKNTSEESINDLYKKSTNSDDNIEVKTSNLYKYDGKITFDGSNYIDTGLKLFSPDNIDKDFEISFEINSIGDNVNLNTIMDSMNETGSPWPGFVVRMSGTNDILFKANSTTTNRKEYTHNKEIVQKVKIRRIGKKLFYSIDDDTEIELMDYSDLAKTFDTPLTFGCSLDGNHNPQRFFKGTLSNINVKILNSENYLTVYEHKGNINFDGTNYVDTGVKLFNEQNINKNFRIEFDLVEIGENGIQATVLNAKDEKESPWPGIHLRTTKNASNMELAATDTTKNVYTYSCSNLPRNIVIKRVNSKFYYNKDNSSYVQLCDFSNIAWTFDVPLTFGCSLDGSRKPFRYFKGVISNVKVELEVQ